MQIASKNYIERRARFNASIFELVREIGEMPSLEEACKRVANFFEAYDATLLVVKVSDWSGLQPAIRPYSNIPDSIKAVSQQLKHFEGCPMTKECRSRLAPFSYQSIDRRKYTSLLDRRFFQETDKLGYRDIAIMPVIAGQGIVICTFGIDRIFDEKLRVYSSGVMQHITAAFLANFPQVAKLFDGKLLSPLEASVLSAFCRGRSVEEVCEELDINATTVPVIWRSAEKKLEAKSRYETIHRAITMGELNLPQPYETLSTTDTLTG